LKTVTSLRQHNTLQESLHHLNAESPIATVNRPQLEFAILLDVVFASLSAAKPSSLKARNNEFILHLFAIYKPAGF